MRLHWRAKMAAKLMLSRIPVPYRAWRQVSLFRHGSMDDPEYAIAVFERHFARSRLRRGDSFTLLELGPGDSVGTALIAYAYGSRATYLVDVGAFATTRMEPYRQLANCLERRGFLVPDVTALGDVEALLEACGAKYLVGGLDSLRSLPTGSIDFIWSHAVLEHIQRQEFTETIRELSRLLRVRALMSHRIDFQDHLSDSLNNLRFASSRWETELFRRSGFYTNRLRPTQIASVFADLGFQTRTECVDQWSSVPIDAADLAPEFRKLDDGQLRTRGLDLVAWRVAPGRREGGSDRRRPSAHSGSPTDASRAPADMGH